MSQINNEAAFATAMGLNPDNIEQGSMKVTMTGDTILLTFTAMHAVAPHLIGAAFLAVSGLPKSADEEETA